MKPNAIAFFDFLRSDLEAFDRVIAMDDADDAGDADYFAEFDRLCERRFGTSAD